MEFEERNVYGLTKRDMKTIFDIFRKYPDVEIVHLFGSRAIGNYKPGSDIDLAIINDQVSAKTISSITSDFEDSSLPYTVDAVNFPELKNNDLTEHIKRGGVLFYP